MSNDIRIVDYVPKDGILCRRCKFYKICPIDYVCPTCQQAVRFRISEGYEE